MSREIKMFFVLVFNRAIRCSYVLKVHVPHSDCRVCRYDYKSDVWALGCILYEMTTLNHAFDATVYGYHVLSFFLSLLSFSLNPYLSCFFPLYLCLHFLRLFLCLVDFYPLCLTVTCAGHVRSRDENHPRYLSTHSGTLQRQSAQPHCGNAIQGAIAAFYQRVATCFLFFYFLSLVVSR